MKEKGFDKRQADHNLFQKASVEETRQNHEGQNHKTILDFMILPLMILPWILLQSNCATDSHFRCDDLNSQYRTVLTSNGLRSGQSDKMRAAMPLRCGAAQLVAGSIANGPR